MTTTSCRVPSNVSTPIGSPLPVRLIDALSRRDFEGLAACLADDVQFRAVLPRGLVELNSAEQVAAKFAGWFGGQDSFQVVDTSAGSIGSRQYVRWLIRMWPPDRPTDSRLVEQHLFTRGTERATCVDLLCSGFHDEHAAS